MNQPTLRTERLELRALKDSDSAAIYRNFSNPEVVKYYNLSLFTEESQAVTLINNWIERRDAGGGMRWAICLKESEELIGTIGFVDIKVVQNSSGIGYEIRIDHSLPDLPFGHIKRC